MHEIGSRRELFVDALLIDRLDGASLKLQEPRPGGVAVRFGEGAGRSVESRRAFYTTVLQDGGAYRMYYRGGSYGRTERGFESHTCYAESGDGVTGTSRAWGWSRWRDRRTTTSSSAAGGSSAHSSTRVQARRLESD